MSNHLGQQLGNYHLIGKLGRGGFADVYLGEHVYLKTRAAIKVLRAQLSENDLENFLKEARAIANLIHPNIVRVLEFGVEGNVPFLIMDYASKGTVRQCYPKGTRLPLQTILTYAKQVAAALQYAHNQRVIHRDVKPENLLIGRNNEILLSDFGIAMVGQGSDYRSGQLVGGTVAYMAPEQLQGHATEASDQYALGIITYEWLCGECPFQGSYFEIASHQVLTPPPSLHQKIDSIPPVVEQVVQKALNKDPQQRFKDVQTFANALEQVCQGVRSRGSLLASDTSISLKRGVSRRVVLVGLGGLVGAAAAGGGIAWVFQRIGMQAPPIGTTIFTYKNHVDAVESVAWAPDGRRIVSGSADKTVQVWDATTGDHNLIYRGHSSRVWSVAWSPDAARITSGSGELALYDPSADDTVQVWDATSGTKTHIYHGHSSQVQAVAWSPNSQRIASASLDDTVQVWKAVNGGNALIYRLHGRPVRAVTWSPDGRRIASGGDDNIVQIFDSTTGNLIFTYRGHSDGLHSVAWSPNGKYIASASYDGSIQVWSTSTGTPIFIHNDSNTRINAVAWSPDSTRIASASWDKTIQVWDVMTRQNIFVYQNHTGVATSVAWSPDGSRIASASWDKTVQVWQAS